MAKDYKTSLLTNYHSVTPRPRRLLLTFVRFGLLCLLMLPFAALGQWTRKADALKKRGECPSVLYQGKVYVFGGFGEHPAIETTNEVYDPAQDKWSSLAPFPSGKAVTHQGVALVDDKIWHIGGRAINADGPVTSQVLIYDIKNDTWTVGPELKDPVTGQLLPIGGGGAALVGRTLHVFGGFAPTICIDQSAYHLTLDVDAWIANPQLAGWENNRAPMPIPRNHLNTVVLGGKIYALGGQFGHDCNGTDQRYAHVYDPVADTWTRLSDVPTARSHAEAATFPVDGKIFMVGGQGPSSVAQNTVLVFTPEANNGLGAWANATEFQLPNNYYGISAKVIDNAFIISHGAITNITNERIETYAAPILRNVPYKFGFTATCLSRTIAFGQLEKVHNLLFTIEGEKEYTLSSNADWLKITRNGSGVALPSAVEIEATVDATNLAPGDYTATITATGSDGGPEFASSSFCVNVKVIAATDAQTLTVNTTGGGSVTKSPNQTVYTSGTNVTLTATPVTGFRFAGWSGDATGSTNPLTLTMDASKTITATFTPLSGLITNIAATSGRAYTLAALASGEKIYTDRTYQVTTVPASLAGASLIQTANDDKKSTAAALLSFTLSQLATVYVAYDPRATVLPSWLSGWQKIPDKVGVNDPMISHMDLYSKVFSMGKVTLGGNLQSPAAGAQNNYFVIAKAGQEQPASYTLSVSTNGNGSVTRTPNQPTYAAGTGVWLTALPASGYRFTGWSGDATGTTNPLFITMDGNKNLQATFSPVEQPVSLVSGIVATSGKPYALAALAVGEKPYTDRTYQLTSVPASLAGASLLQTANDDKFNTSSALLSFTLSKQATVYVAYDPRATILPAWLSGWQKQPERIGVNDSKISYMDLYSKTFPAGSVSLGGNLQSPAAGAQNNYFVIAKEIPVRYTLTLTIDGKGTVVKNPDQPSYEAGTTVTLIAIPGQWAQFSGWYGDVYETSDTLTVLMDSDKNIEAQFLSPLGYTHTLSVITNGDGKVLIDPQQDSYDFGTVVNLTAIPTEGNRFVGWSGDVSDDYSHLILYMYSDKNITATFEPIEYSITVQATAGGTASISPLKTAYTYGELVTLTATPEPGYEFVNWTGGTTSEQNPLSLTVTDNITVTANFRLKRYSLTVTSGIGGSVSRSPDLATYEHGTSVTLTATPDAGYQFSGWSGAATGALNPIVVTMDADKTVTAEFAAIPATGTTVRINAGGAAKNIAGMAWAGCTAASTCTNYVAGGSPYAKTAAVISGIPPFMDQEMFETGWTNTLAGNAKKGTVAFTYNIPVTNGDYVVRLYFAELEKTAAGQRVFDVNLEGGKKELSSFDVFREAGANAALTRAIPMKIADGTVTIEFIRQVGNPVISAIEILPASAASTATATAILSSQASKSGEMLKYETTPSLKVYPNPLSGDQGRVELANFGKNERVRLTLYSASGQLVYETTLETNEAGASTTTLEPGNRLRSGIYYLQATAASGTSHFKLVID